MTTETIQIQQLASGEVTVKLIGDHVTSLNAPATIPYLLTAALFQLVKDGTAIKLIQKTFGIELAGTLKIEETKE